MCTGLSPLARGTPARKVGEFPQMRFIPASAGNSSTRAINPADHSVYPRWRGELEKQVPSSANFAGLSPLAWGTRFQTLRAAYRDRFIPAGAGNSSTLSITTDREPVYPRWRGELPDEYHEMMPMIGLSPLARGTRTPMFVLPCGGRFIPAGAGNS